MVVEAVDCRRDVIFIASILVVVDLAILYVRLAVASMDIFAKGEAEGCPKSRGKIWSVREHRHGRGIYAGRCFRLFSY